MLPAAAGAALAVAGLLAWAEGPRPLGLLAVPMALGWIFVRTDFGYASAFRAFLARGDGAALAAGLVVPAVAAPVVLPVAALWEDYWGTVGPLGPPLILGAAMFGVGMQLASGCGSGAMYAAGSGSRRLLVALPFFCAGGLLGSLVLPAALRLPDLGVVDPGERLGPWGGLLATEALLAALAVPLLRRGPLPGAAALKAAALIGALAGLAF